MVPGTGIDPILVVYAVAAFNSAVLAGVLWRYRDRTGAVPLLAHVLAAGVWAGSVLALEVVEPGLLALAFLGLLFLAVGFTVMALLVFTLEYTGRERFITRPALLALSIEPVLAAVIAVVNPGNVFFRSYVPVEWGPAFWVHTAYSYVLLTVVTALILEFLYRSRSLYRGQSAALLGATVVGWIANVVYTFGPVEVDTSPIGFLVSGALFAVAIVRYRLTDIVPIARDRVLDTISDAVFVVDEEDRLIDANPVARGFLAAADSSPIGTGIESLFADRPDLLAEYDALTETPATRERELEFDGSYFHVRTTPVEDSRDRHVGWLFIVREITERKRHEMQLERQNDRLERFADVVSHDLRNPLSVASGYLDLARNAEDPDAHLDQIERSHERMETIIDDVLTLAREGTAVTDPEAVALDALAERAWQNVDANGAALTIASTAAIRADTDRVTRLLENLFRNSLEHGTDGPDGTDLEITVGTIDGADGSLEGFYVADDGTGLPDDGDRVFEDGYSTAEDGTGFGLSIVGEIAEVHGWSVAATEGTAGGARFEFRGVEPAASSAAESDPNRESPAS